MLAFGGLLLTLLAALSACSDTQLPGEFPPTEPIARRDLSGCSIETPVGCVTVSDGAPAETRLTLFNVMTPKNEGMYLIDGTGRILQYFATSGADGEPLPEPGTLLAFIERPGPPSFLRLIQFRTPCVAILDRNGTATWPNEAPPGAYCGQGIEPIPYRVDENGNPSADAHHDVHLWGAPVYPTPQIASSQGDGRILYVSQAELTPERAQAIAGPGEGRVGDEPLVEIAGDAETVLWEWLAADHFDEFGFDEDARAAIAAFARGQAPSGVPTPPNQGFLLVNAAAYLGPNRHCPDPTRDSCDHRFHPDNVLVSARQAAMMFIVARHPHPRGDWPEGTVVWQLGPDFEDTPHGPISGQHHAHMIPIGLPGGGNILVFDNGSGAGFGRTEDGALTAALYQRGYSRVVEIDPATGAIAWSYEQPEEGADGTPRFNAFNLSSTQRLPTGNTLIVEGNSGRLFEVTPAGEIVWEFVSPFPPLVSIPFPTGTLAVGVYRGYRVPVDWWF